MRNCSRPAWAREQAVPEITRLADAFKFEDGFVLATRAMAILPADSNIVQVSPRVRQRFAVTSVPTGARAYWQRLDATHATWNLLGNTPLDSVDVPFGPSRLRFEKDGYRPYQMFVTPMSSVSLVPSQPDAAEDLGRLEVTNREFRRFVNAGGYTKRDLWSADIRHKGAPVAWTDAVKSFTVRMDSPWWLRRSGRNPQLSPGGGRLMNAAK